MPLKHVTISSITSQGSHGGNSTRKMVVAMDTELVTHTISQDVQELPADWAALH